MLVAKNLKNNGAKMTTTSIIETYASQVFVSKEEFEIWWQKWTNGTMDCLDGFEHHFETDDPLPQDIGSWIDWTNLFFNDDGGSGPGWNPSQDQIDKMQYPVQVDLYYFFDKKEEYENNN